MDVKAICQKCQVVFDYYDGNDRNPFGLSVFFEGAYSMFLCTLCDTQEERETISDNYVNKVYSPVYRCSKCNSVNELDIDYCSDCENEYIKRLEKQKK